MYSGGRGRPLPIIDLRKAPRTPAPLWPLSALLVSLGVGAAQCPVSAEGEATTAVP